VTGTKDLQMVNISLRILSRPQEDQLALIYRNLGADFDEKILPNLGNEVLKAVVAQYNAEELLSKRALVSKGIRESLIERAGKFGLILDDVSITHLTFGKEYSKAIEHKQVAQQEAETQAYVVLKADQERKAAVIRAEGEAEAAELLAKAMNTAGTGLIEVRRIDTAKEVAHILAHGKNVTYLPSGGNGSNLLLNVGSGNNASH
jgi:prohibitin 1